MAKGASQARSMLALFTGEGSEILCFMEAGESGKMLSSQITDELKLVVHPVGSIQLFSFRVSRHCRLLRI
ncbi:hypothetical protein KSC_020090 [Ktedonobacter sp. SOSP1-52]|nr:hypothetical protein KSC_020090 [Ktedonobacter sp. SOSP1-52]